MSVNPDCRFGPGEVVPVIDRERCENKATCAAVCPYDVLVIRTLTDADQRELGLIARIKVWAHGGKQAYADFPDRCHGCGLCISACPERAITLKRVK